MAHRRGIGFTPKYDPPVNEREHVVDRLWPDPAAGLDLADAMAGFRPGEPPPDRPLVAINMVTTVTLGTVCGTTKNSIVV